MYFDFKLSDSDATNKKVEAAVLSLLVNEGLLEPLTSQGQKLTLTVHLLSTPELLSISQHVLFMAGQRSQELQVQARYFAPGSVVELVLHRVSLDTYEDRSVGAQISILPRRVDNDTSAVFLIPPGLASGVHSLTLRYAATRATSNSLHVLVMQEAIPAS